MKIFLIGMIFLIGLITTIFAQTKTDDSLHHNIDSYLRYIPSRDVDAMSGKVEIIESSSEYGYELKILDKLPVKFSFQTQYIGIEDTVEVELPSHLMGLVADLETTLPFFNFPKTYLRLGLSPSFYGDDTSFEASSFRIPSQYFLIYQPDARWTFLGGIAVYPDFEYELLPILGFIYKPNDKLIFNIIPKRSNISYQVFDRVTLFAEGGTSLNREFEVTENNFKNAVIRYKETHLGGGIKYKFNKFIQSSITVGGVFNRSLRYRDSLGKVNIKGGLYTEFRIEAAF